MDDDYGPMGRGRGQGWQGRDDVGWGMHDGIGVLGWLLMAFLLLLLIALIVGVVLLVVRSSGRGGALAGRGGAKPSPAEHMLDERFARGEIDEEEYLHRRSVLRDGGPPG
jgi:putative membrane protein